MQIKNFRKVVANLHDKPKYVKHIWNLNQALNNRLVFKIANRGIKFNKKALLKQYIDKNANLKIKK